MTVTVDAYVSYALTLNKLINEWMNEWINEWMNEWFIGRQKTCRPNIQQDI